MSLGMEVGLGPGDMVLDGDPAPPPKGAQQPSHFSAHVYCGQTSVYIKMPLCMEVCLGPGDTVLDGASAPTERGTAAPHFLPMSIVAKRSPISVTAEFLLPLESIQSLSPGLYTPYREIYPQLLCDVDRTRVNIIPHIAESLSEGGLMTSLGEEKDKPVNKITGNWVTDLHKHYG